LTHGGGEPMRVNRRKSGGALACAIAGAIESNESNESKESNASFN